MFKSIRWRFLSWLTLILLVAITGFGASLFYLVRHSKLKETEAELRGAANVIVEKLRGRSGRRPSRPSRGGPFGFRPGSDEDVEAILELMEERPDRRDSMRRDMGRGRGPDRGSDRRGRMSRGGRRPERYMEERHDRFLEELTIPESLLNRFGEGDEAPYFVVWRSGGRIMKQSGTPEGFELPPSPEGDHPEASFFRQREARREFVMAGPHGLKVLVGRSIQKELSELRSLAGSVLGMGLAVLLLGVAGGWFIAKRAIRPIQSISSTAESISASDFSRRIDIESTETELGSLAMVLNTTFDRLQEAFEDQARFTADASHELRTPVAAILAQTAMARRKERSASEYREVIDACYVVAKRMKSLVVGLLTLARTDADDLDLRHEEFDLRKTAEECSRMVEAIAVKRGLSFEIDLEPVKLRGDADRISQVVTNLLTNAVRYNRKGGRVAVALREEGADVVLSVSDTGVGISPEDQARIFDRFYRVDKARSRRVGGSGLGLAISKAIVEAHGGTITCESGPETGTTFAVRLPRRSGQSERRVASLKRTGA